LPSGSTLGWYALGSERPLDVYDDNGEAVHDYYFAVEDGALVTKRPLMPSMFTLDKTIIRQDCLGYLMERLLPE